MLNTSIKTECIDYDDEMIQYFTLQWRHGERDGVSNHRRLDGSLSCLFRRRSKETLKLRVTGLRDGNLPGTGEFPSQRASNAENVSISWRHYIMCANSWFHLTHEYGNDIHHNNTTRKLGVSDTFSSKFGICPEQKVWQYHNDVIKWKHLQRYWSLWWESTGHRSIPYT